MKKILFLIAAVAGLFTTSCKNDEIDILQVDTPEPFKTLTLNVSTTSSYDKMDITSSIKSLLSDESYYVGVTTLVYNKSNDSIVAQKSDYSKTLNQISQEFTLERGEYRIITIQNLVNSAYDYTSETWEFKDIDKSSTLSMYRKTQVYEGEEYYPNLYWYDVIGFNVKDMSISSDTQEKVLPEPIGALVDCNFEYFNKSPYYSIGFFTKDEPIGIKLSPDINIGEQFVYENGYLPGDTWTSRVSYWPESSDENHQGATVYLLEEGTVECFFAVQPISTSNSITPYWPNSKYRYVFEKGGIYYGGIAYTGLSNSPCTTYMGPSESGFQNWYNGLTAPVSSTSVTFKAPYIQWGASVSTVKSYMNGYTLTDDIQAATNGGYWMQYNGKDDESLYEYDFETKTSGLKEAYVAFDAEKIDIESICSYFNNNENFSALTYYSSLDFYGSYSIDGKTGLIVYKENGLWILNYYDSSAYAARQYTPHRANSLNNINNRMQGVSAKLTIAPVNVLKYRPMKFSLLK